MSTLFADQEGRSAAAGSQSRLEFPAWPHYADDEVAAATAVLRSGRVNYWTGTEARSLEQEYAKAIGVRHAVTLANGSVALELALAMLGIGPGDEVITSPRTFIASASCAIMRGAKPVFADVDRDSQTSAPRRSNESCRRARAPSSWSISPGGHARWNPSYN